MSEVQGKPISLRAAITTEELRALKAAAAIEGLTFQVFLAKLIRSRLQEEPSA